MTSETVEATNINHQSENFVFSEFLSTFATFTINGFGFSSGTKELSLMTLVVEVDCVNPRERYVVVGLYVVELFVVFLFVEII